MSAQPAEKLPVKPSVTLKRRLNAAPAQVYAAWTNPAQLARWFGPADTVDGSVKADLDVRVGGRFRVSFTGCMDGNSEYHEVGGVYREVVPNEKLVFTWAWHSTPERESLVTITIKPDGDGSHPDAASRTILRSGRRRRTFPRLERIARQARKDFSRNNTEGSSI